MDTVSTYAPGDHRGWTKCETTRMDESKWTEVDEYLATLLLPTDDALDQAVARSAAAHLPAINVASNQGKFLELLAAMQRSRRILEIGTLGGTARSGWLGRCPVTVTW